MLELDGDTTRLMAASQEIARRMDAPEGLLVRIAAPTEYGMVLFQLWETAEARQRNAEDPAHTTALEASGMTGLVRRQPLARLRRRCPAPRRGNTESLTVAHVPRHLACQYT